MKILLIFTLWAASLVSAVIDGGYIKEAMGELAHLKEYQKFLNGKDRTHVFFKQYMSDHPSPELPYVIFLHGGPGIINNGQYDLFLSEFLKEGYRVYVPEIVGSSWEDPGLDLSLKDAINVMTHQSVKDIEAIVQTFEGHPFILIGHSLGGGQALWYTIISKQQKPQAFVAISPGVLDAAADAVINIYLREQDSAITRKISAAELLSKIKKMTITDLYPQPNAYTGKSVVVKQEMLGMELSPVVDLALNHRISPLAHVKVDLPPIFVFTAADDAHVSPYFSLKLVEILQEKSVSVSALFQLTGGHSGVVKDEEIEKNRGNFNIFMGDLKGFLKTSRYAHVNVAQLQGVLHFSILPDPFDVLNQLNANNREILKEMVDRWKKETKKAIVEALMSPGKKFTLNKLSDLVELSEKQLWEQKDLDGYESYFIALHRLSKNLELSCSFDS